MPSLVHASQESSSEYRTSADRDVDFVVKSARSILILGREDRGYENPDSRAKGIR